MIIPSDALTLALRDATSAIAPEQRLPELITHVSIDELEWIDPAFLGLLDLLRQQRARTEHRALSA